MAVGDGSVVVVGATVAVAATVAGDVGGGVRGAARGAGAARVDVYCLARTPKPGD